MNDYKDMVKLQRPKSNHPKMSRDMRAAQFSPFSALSGYEDAIKEAERLTYKESILSEDYRCELDYILSVTDKDTPVEITFFIKDRSKKGGSYITKKSKISSIDRIDEKITLEDGSILKISDVKKIQILSN